MVFNEYANKDRSVMCWDHVRQILLLVSAFTTGQLPKAVKVISLDVAPGKMVILFGRPRAPQQIHTQSKEGGHDSLTEHKLLS